MYQNGDQISILLWGIKPQEQAGRQQGLRDVCPTAEWKFGLRNSGRIT